jgi:rubrerythrin
MTGMPNPQVEWAAIPLCPWCGWYATIRTPDSWACPWCGATTNGQYWWRPAW